MYDVIVIGSGVAGSAAAYKLAEAGKNILVLEKELLPRYKTCGGGVISKVGELLPYKIDPVVEC
ncbi:FAD-dependent oxidoreductase, partial [bacterium BMS3Abin03]|nr:FAD-dependent oxidoreductase [bacterium BMS3Abin03]